MSPIVTLAYGKSRSPLKVSVIFALGIILPSIFLGYLGIRSYQSENQLMRKEAEEHFAVSANLIEIKVSEQVTALLSDLRSVAARPGFQRLDYADIVPFLLSQPRLDHLALTGLFVFDEDARMVAPWPAALLPTGSASSRREFDWGPISDEIDRLEHLEFVDKNISAALQGYKALQERNVPPAIRAELLKNIAGDYRKLNQKRLAAGSYLQLALRYESLQDLSGFPFGVLGRQMTIEIDDEDHLTQNALDNRLDLFEGCLLRRWNLTGMQFTTVMQDQRRAIERLISSRTGYRSEQKARWERLDAMDTQLKALEQRGEHFANNEWPTVLHRVRQIDHLDRGAVMEMPTAHPTTIAVVVPILEPGTERRRGILVGLLSADSVWGVLNDVMSTVANPAGLNVEWAHGKSSTSLHLWKTVLERDVQAIDPPFRFQLAEADISTRNELFRRRRWVFSGMIGLSFLVILIGLGITFHAVKREVEVANLKSDFVANVSHELRTPLAAISHIGERLSLGRYRSDEERKEFYGLLGKETHRLKGLVEDILDFSKVLAGKKMYRQDPVDFLDVVQKSIQAFEPKATSHGFQVAVKSPAQPVWIIGDAKALQQALLNLLDNAMKYSGDSRKVDVIVEESPSNAILAVKDYGVGIAERDHEKIFEKFYRVERGPLGQTEGGVGLGLAMVKHVIDGHGGKINVESHERQGSTFSVVLPRGEEKTS